MAGAAKAPSTGIRAMERIARGVIVRTVILLISDFIVGNSNPGRSERCGMGKGLLTQLA
jgi:hypothetical protein